MNAHPAGPRHAEIQHAPGLPPRPVASSEMTTLPAQVWPRGAKRGDDGVVSLAGVPVTELAAKYGFADQAHLTRVFRRHAGELPKVVRAALRGTAAPARTEQESSTPRTPPSPE